MELELLKWLQGHSNPFILWIMDKITMLGETGFVILCLIILYYAYDKELGKRSIVLFGVSMCLNLSLKELLHAPRPIGQPDIVSHRVSTATGYSFPSGHTQSFSTLVAVFADIFRRRWVLITGIALAFLVGLSRLILGVHWPKDVLFGWFFALFAYYLVRYLRTQLSEGWIQFGVICILHVVAWFYPGADLIKFAGVMLGCGIGFPLEQRYIRFENTLNLQYKILRVLIGGIFLGTLYIGMKLLFPDALYAAYLRYFIIGFSASAIFPYVIKHHLT